MLLLDIPATKFWDEINEEFIIIDPQTIELEHSLVSISKWESKWHKPFLDEKRDKTHEEILDYIKCMTITPNIPPETYLCLTDKHMMQIHDYINDPMTASTVRDDKKNKNSREIVTSELIYYWMISLQIPVEFEHWHISRLMMLIKICAVKNSPPDKRSKRDIMSSNAAKNAARRARTGSKG